MKKRLLLLMVLLFSCTFFSHAGFDFDLGKSVKTGLYYTFPEAIVDDYDASGDLIYQISIQFVREATAGDQIILPRPLPGSWSEKARSTTSAYFIDIASGAPVSDVENFLKSVKISLASKEKGNEVVVMLAEGTEAHGREIYWFGGTEHWYEYVAGMHPWWYAYNEAMSKDFEGSYGYLATVISAAENDFVYNVSSGRMAWLGGTRGDIRTAPTTDGTELEGAPEDNLSYWYWATGPEYMGDPEWSAFYKKKKYADPDPNPDPWEYGLPYDYNAWAPNQPDNANGNEAYLHIGSYNNSSWNDYGVNGSGGGKAIAGFMVEYEASINMKTSHAIVGFESTKNAFIDGVLNNGTATDPVKVVLGDEILYEITAVNSSAQMPYVSIIDELPEGLEYVDGSITGENGFYDDYTRTFSWSHIPVQPEDKVVVSYKATPVSFTTDTMKNTALVISDEPIPARSYLPPIKYEFQTDTTYHVGVVCEVSFDYEPATPPGTHSGDDSTQIVNYGKHPKAGVVVTPPPGRKFVGWSYPAYTSVKGKNMPAALGIIEYDTITVYGDIDLTARWDFQFAVDTVYECTGPYRLESGHDGLDYKWFLPDGSTLTTEDIEAKTSGRYILHTNYGSMITKDTIVVQYAFNGDEGIEKISVAGPKLEKEQIFTVNMDTALTNVTYQWTFDGGADPATSTSDTVSVIYKTTGKKHISVDVTVTLGDGTVCTKTFTFDFEIFKKYRNFFVDQHVAGGEEDGSSWQDAYRRIEDALTKATEGDCIWVAKGTYTPPAGTSYYLTRDSIEIYGGFAAFEEYLYERNIAVNPTVLQGSGSSSSVIVNSNAGKISRWDGFIIERGAAVQGGGIFNEKSDLTIANCIIRGNKATEGGGMYTASGNPLIYNVEISGNTAQEGGAIYNRFTNPQFINTTISGNFANTAGGMYSVESNPQILNSIIWGNRADKHQNIVSHSSDPFFNYSIIGDFHVNGEWDNAIGTDGGQNSGQGPLFKVTGFDKEGKMRVGNYLLGPSSPAIDRGLNRYVSGISVRWNTHLQTLTEVAYYSGIPNDLAYNERIGNDRVDIGAYEYGSDLIDPVIQREVHLPYVEGLTFNPGPGKHIVRSQSDFVFTVSAMLRSNGLDNLTIETGDEVRDKDGIQMEKNEDGSVTVTIKRVTENLMITVNGVSPTSTESVEELNVWSYNRNVYVKSDKLADVRIYDMNGRLYLQRKVEAGETIIPLSQGFYTVLLDNKGYKVVIK